MVIERATEEEAPLAAAILREVSERLVLCGAKRWDVNKIDDVDVARPILVALFRIASVNIDFPCTRCAAHQPSGPEPSHAH